MFGIDVSSYQGVIDWKKVKKTDVEFAILKIIRKDLSPDNQFENNWKGCTEAALPIHSVYNYSYATTVSKGVSDAKKVLQILNGRKAKVCLDVEDACQKGLGKLLIDIIDAYAEVITSAGYEFFVYTGLSFYNSYIKPYGLKYPLWIARYGKNDGKLDESYKPNVPNMIGWQYTSKATVDGITGNVDMNVWYDEMESENNVGKYASKVVEQATAWIGKKESDGSHKEIIDIYNAHKPLARSYKVKYTDAWCATTVSAIAIKLGYTDIIPTECSCQQMIALFKNIGSWVENEDRTPKSGDIIFYDWQDDGKGDAQGWSDHVGVVEKVSNGKITVIEGNYDNAVKRRTLDVNGRYIRGYGVPKYDAENASYDSAKPLNGETKPVTKKDIEVIAQEVIDGLWGSGDARKAKLKAAGYDYVEVQKKVNDLLAKASMYYPRYTGQSTSVDVVFEKIGVPSKFIGKWSKRKPIAEANGISDYRGKAGQNLELVALAKKGQLKKV